MELPPSALENPGRILSGFNEATITSLGDVVLPVQVGPVTLNVQFSMVKDLSLFNTIMGRTWLHSMKVIPFAYHHMVSYLTEDKQIDLFGNQLVACQCYQVVLESELPTNREPCPKPSNTEEQ